uniref:Uncharacterized protein n=1 Tax=Peronospora matthiolae TaxID=2874970 RepID=A0AAV1UUJ2_9STRA
MRESIQGVAGWVLDHDDDQHSTDFDGEALRRLEVVTRISSVAAVLKDTPEYLQQFSIQGFFDHELADLRRRASNYSITMTSEVVKLDIASYSVEGPKRSPLIAGSARCISQYKLAKSRLSSRALS